MKVSFPLDEQDLAGKMRVEMDPLLRALQKRPEFSEVTVIVAWGTVVFRFIRHDGERYDTCMGAPAVAAMLLDHKRGGSGLITGVNILLRKTQERITRRLIDGYGILRGADGALAPV